MLELVPKKEDPLGFEAPLLPNRPPPVAAPNGCGFPNMPGEVLDVPGAAAEEPNAEVLLALPEPKAGVCDVFPNI